MILFALLFFVSLFFTIKNITAATSPFYVFITTTNLAAWIVLYASSALGGILLYTILGLGGLLVYFMMKTRPYEKS